MANDLLAFLCHAVTKRRQMGLFYRMICILFIFNSCQNKEKSIYFHQLERAVDLFYLENQNDTLLTLLDQLPSDDPKNESHWVAEILRAGALAESGNPDSALLLLQSLPVNLYRNRTEYYRRSMLALTHFRLDDYQHAYEILTALKGEKTEDLRAMALNERIEGRILNYFEQYEESILQFISSREHFRKAGLTKSVAINDKFLASIYTDLGSNTDVWSRLSDAERVLKDADDPIELYYVYIVALKHYVKREMPDSARYYAMQAMETAVFNTDPQSKATLWYYLGAIEMMQGRKTEASELLERIVEMEEPYFGSARNKARALTKLANLYNGVQQHEEAQRYANKALRSTDEPLSIYRYEAFRELAIATLPYEPLLFRSYMDSALHSLNRHIAVATTDIADFVSAEMKLNQASLRIKRMQERKKRESLIFYFTVGTTCLFLMLYILLKRMKDRFRQTSGELVKKNLEQIKQEEKVNELLKEQKKLLRNNKIENNLSQQQKETILFHDFEEWLVKNHRYRDPDLNLYIAARELMTNRSYLSGAINAQGVKFTEIINRYRIREAIRIFRENDDPMHHGTVEEVASVVGFRSKSVFFDAFRRETGMTPSHFRETIRYAAGNELRADTEVQGDLPTN